MKPRSRSILAALTICACSLLLASLAYSEDASGVIVGAWELKEAQGLPSGVEFAEFRLVFRDSGFLSMTMKTRQDAESEEHMVTYEIRRQEVLLQQHPAKVTWSLDGDILTLKGLIPGTTCLFARAQSTDSRASKEDLASLLKRLPDPGAIAALADIGPEAREAVPPLIDIVWEKDIRHQDNLGIAAALRAIDPDYAVSILTNSLHTDGVSRNWNSAFMLGAMRCRPEVVVPSLISALRKGNNYLDGYCIRALAQFGDDAAPALPLLVDRIVPSRPRTSSGAIEAVAAIGASPECDPKPKLVAVISESTQSPSERANGRILAAYALHRVGQPDSQTVKALIGTLESENQQARIASAMVLGSYGPVAEKASRQLRELLADPDFEVRLAAGLALNRISPRTEQPGRDAARIIGKCIHVTHGLPGALSGRPGEPIPPRPVPGTQVFFLTKDFVVSVTARQDGTYEAVLPPGRYELAWQTPAFGDEAYAFQEHRVFTWRDERIPAVELEAKQVLKKDIAVSQMFVD